RWFALDDETPAMLPRLAGWVARTGDVRAAAAAASEPLGHIEALSRGTLRWLLTVPGDGSLPMGGAAPMVLEWHTQGQIGGQIALRCLAPLIERRLARTDPEQQQAAGQHHDVEPRLVGRGPEPGLAGRGGEAPESVAEQDRHLGRRDRDDHVDHQRERGQPG